MSIVSKNIATLRKRKRLSQEKMADELGITRQRLGSYEETRSEPNIEMIIKLCKYFDVSITELLTLPL